MLTLLFALETTFKKENYSRPFLLPPPPRGHQPSSAFEDPHPFRSTAAPAPLPSFNRISCRQPRGALLRLPRNKQLLNIKTQVGRSERKLRPPRPQSPAMQGQAHCFFSAVAARIEPNCDPVSPSPSLKLRTTQQSPRLTRSG